MHGKARLSEAVELYRPAGQPSLWWICFGISMFVHLVFAGALLLSPLGASDARMIDRSSAITVDLVAMNPEVSAPPEKGAQATSSTDFVSADSGTPAEAREQQPIPVKKSVKKNVPTDYELKMPEPEVKTALKKKTFQKEEVIAHAVRQMAEKAEQRRPASIEKRIAQMEKDVGKQAYHGRLTGSKSGKTAALADPDQYGPMEIYQAEVAVRMKHNWAFNPEMAGGLTDGLETRLVIKILPDGTVSEIWYEKRSGNAYLDESAYKTIKKASPLPPLPEGYPHYHLVLGFTPGGLAHR